MWSTPCFTAYLYSATILLVYAPTVPEARSSLLHHGKCSEKAAPTAVRIEDSTRTRVSICSKLCQRAHHDGENKHGMVPARMGTRAHAHTRTATSCCWSGRDGVVVWSVLCGVIGARWLHPAHYSRCGMCRRGRSYRQGGLPLHPATAATLCLPSAVQLQHRLLRSCTHPRQSQQHTSDLHPFL